MRAPPSRDGNGRRLRTARFTLNSATNRRNGTGSRPTSPPPRRQSRRYQRADQDGALPREALPTPLRRENGAGQGQQRSDRWAIGLSRSRRAHRRTLAPNHRLTLRGCKPHARVCASPGVVDRPREHGVLLDAPYAVPPSRMIPRAPRAHRKRRGALPLSYPNRPSGSCSAGFTSDRATLASRHPSAATWLQTPPLTPCANTRILVP